MLDYSKQAKDACLLDTTDKTIQECVDFIVSIVLGVIIIVL